MGSGKGGQTIGYHYLMSMMMGLGRGPINELVTIKVGDEVAWDGSLCDGLPRYINKPNLFGGEKKEGGVQGPFALYNGAADQVLPVGDVTVPTITTGAPGSGIIFLLGGKFIKNGVLPALKSLVPGRVTELRGRAVIWFDGLVTSMNPYPKEWKFRVRRTQAGWFNDDPWYPQKATVFLEDGKIHAMNGAHIIYECVTNPEWGRGHSPDLINENSFIYAANTLCSEKFGLCLPWYRKEDIDAFIQVVIDHIGATLYTDRETGLLTLRLIRDDYDPEDLPLFTEDTGLLSILEDDSSSTDTQFNEMQVTGRDPITDTDIIMRAHSLAGWQAQGATATMDQKYPGLPTDDLCARVAVRDLRVNASGLKRYKVVLDRRGFRIAPGMPFRISAPKRNIGEIILRAGEIDDGKMVQGRIEIAAVQDVFGMPSTAYVSSAPTTWQPPSAEAVPPTDSMMVEINYREALLLKTEAEAQAVTETQGFAALLAEQPTSDSIQYEFISKVTGEDAYKTNGSFAFTASARLAETIEPLQTTFEIDNIVGLPDSIIDTALRIGDEIMGVTAFDALTNIVTVKRGCVDTVPAPHTLGGTVWFSDDDMGVDVRTYAPSEIVYGKALTATTRDQLTEPEGLEKNVTISARVPKPYPPADVKVDGDSIYSLTGPYPSPVLTWVERNRLTQADQLVGHEEATIAPEAGTTYRVTVFDGSGQIGLYDDIAALTWEYDSTMQAADGAVATVTFRLQTKRDGLLSTYYDIPVSMAIGYGYGYGLNYGGVA